MTPRLMTLLYALALAAGIAVLYAFGFNNQLVFDDARLASLPPLQPQPRIASSLTNAKY